MIEEGIKFLQKNPSLDGLKKEYVMFMVSDHLREKFEDSAPSANTLSDNAAWKPIQEEWNRLKKNKSHRTR